MFLAVPIVLHSRKCPDNGSSRLFVQFWLDKTAERLTGLLCISFTSLSLSLSLLMSETEIIRRQAREKCSFRPQTVITIREQRLQRWQNKLREFATAAGITHPTQDKLFCLSLYTCGLFRLSSVRFRSFLALGLGLRYHERSRVFWRKPIQ